MKRHLPAAAVAVAGLLVPAALLAFASPASADTTAKASCTDAGGHTWRVSTVWSAKTYKEKDGTTRIINNNLSFTTAARDADTVDYTVTTYDGVGKIVSTKKVTDAPFNFKAGTQLLTLDPRNPPTSPGRSKLVLSVGDGNDGKANCSITFIQPGAVVAPSPPATPRPTATPAPTPTLTPTPTPTASPTSVPGAKALLLGIPHNGVVPWHSGFWTGGDFSNEHVAQLEANRGGSRADIVTAYVERDQGWDGFRTNMWSYTVQANGGRQLNLGVPLVVTGDTLANVANGSHDDDFAQVGRNLQATHPQAYVRLGWEANIPDWAWSGKDPATYKAAFNHAAVALKSTCPKCIIEYGIALSPDHPGLDTYYPGDANVDSIGADVYDWYSTKASDPRLRQELDKVATFARAHHKGTGVGEWGVVNTSNGAGDDPAFINTMKSWMSANADIMFIDCYFDEKDRYLDSSLLPTSQGAATDKTKSRAAYAAAF